MTDTPSPSDEPKNDPHAWIPHVMPFAMWLFLMKMLEDLDQWNYVLRSALCLGIFIYYRPWKWYPKFNPRDLLPGILVGILVFVFWIALETPWASKFPRVQKVYLTFFTQDLGAMLAWAVKRPLFASAGLWSAVIPALLAVLSVALLFWRKSKLGKIPNYVWYLVGLTVLSCVFYLTDLLAPMLKSLQAFVAEAPPAPWSEFEMPKAEDKIYAPEHCGWTITWIRILGSAFVIAFIEEYFWRGWMYRWIVDEDFLSVPLDKLVWWAVIAGAVMFSLVHHRWLAALLCGICYGLLIIKTKNVWAGGVAHATTNLLLGIYVVYADQHQFWV